MNSWIKEGKQDIEIDFNMRNFDGQFCKLQESWDNWLVIWEVKYLIFILIFFLNIFQYNKIIKLSFLM